jgi:hypothetical protein
LANFMALRSRSSNEDRPNRHQTGDAVVASGLASKSFFAKRLAEARPPLGIDFYDGSREVTVQARGPRYGILAATVAAMPMAFVAACSVGVSGEAPADLVADAGADVTIDSPTQTDAGTDAAPDTGSGNDSATPMPDASVADASVECDAGLLCHGQCLGATDCSSCSGATLLCAATRTCASSCDACRDTNDKPLPTECYSCDSNYKNPIGQCAPADATSYCLSGSYFGSYGGGAGYHCSCPSGDAADCPGSTQVCATIGAAKLCVTCGEPTPMSLSGVACKTSGTSCNPDALTCQ